MPALSPEDIAELATALRTAREILRYTLPALAEAAAVDEARLRAFEAGTAIPTRPELARLWGIIASDAHAARVRVYGPSNGTRP